MMKGFERMVVEAAITGGAVSLAAVVATMNFAPEFALSLPDVSPDAVKALGRQA